LEFLGLTQVVKADVLRTNSDQTLQQKRSREATTADLAMAHPISRVWLDTGNALPSRRESAQFTFFVICQDS
jgi:hypothetical protein